jgi:alpha-glucoside transport system permease protein
MLIALRNNALWLLLMVPGTIAGGLFFAILADRVPYEKVAKSIIFMPVAISFIGAGIIWRFVYDFQSGGGAQIGVLNAIITAFGGKPVTWLSDSTISNFSLMLVGVWLWVGFCMTMLSAAIKNVSTEILEASRVDGANEWQVFWKIMFPTIAPSIVVVTTTLSIIILKVFDVVYVMTGGNYGTEVIANRMFNLIVTNTGRSTALAVLLILFTIPIMVFNIKRFKQEEAAR